MANVTVTTSQPNITVDANLLTVNVSTTTSNIVVSNIATVSNADVRSSLSVVDAGGDGSLTYSNTTGVFTYTGPSQAEVLAHFSNVSPVNLEANGQISIDETALFSGKTTDDLAEGNTNLYYTNARVNAYVIDAGLDFNAEKVDDRVANLMQTSGNLTYTYDDNANTLTLSQSLTTTDITEGDNLYYTDARARAAISRVDAGGDGSFTYDNSTGVMTYTGPSASEVRAHFSGQNGITYSSSTGVIELTDSELISGVFAGNGLVGGGNTGNVTLNVQGNTGITVHTDDIEVNMGDFTTSDLAEGTNLYYTTDRANTAIGVYTGSMNSIAGISASSNIESTAWLIGKHEVDHFVQSVNDLGTTSGNITIDCDSGGTVLANINADVTGISLTNVRAGTSLSIIFRQDGVGNRNLDTTTHASNWSGWEFTSAYKEFSSGPNDADIMTVYYDGTNYFASIVPFDAPSSLNLTGNITAGGMTINGEATITGNLEVQGNIDYVNVVDLLVNDQSITLNYGNATARDGFIYIDRSGSGGANVNLKWNETTDKWQFTNDGTTYYDLPTSTSDVAEGTNLYFTAARARGNISLTTQTASGNGALTYDSGTGVFDFTPADTSLATKDTDDLSEGATNLYYTQARFDSAFSGKSTSDLSEGTNLYYTDARSRSALSVSTGTPSGNGSLTYTSGTGVFDFVPADVPDNTDELSEGATNLYYTTDRANAAIQDYLDGTNVVISSDSNITTTANIQGDYVIADTAFEGDLNGAVMIDVYNGTGGTLNKGQVVYLTGAETGDNPHVDLADSDDASKMPAIGVVKENIADTAVGQVITSGEMNYQSHGLTLGADIYVDTTAGGLTTTVPTGEDKLIQKIGKVVGTNHILVQGAFRTNATPNLNDGNIFVGNASNQAVTADLSNFGYEIVSNANIETSANIINENAIISRDSIPSGEFQEVIPASGGALYPGYFFGLAQSSMVVDVGDAGESFSRGTSSITGTGVAITFQDYTGNGNANLNGVTFYLGGGDYSGQFSTYAVYTDSGLTTLANVETLGVDGGQGAGGWGPDPLDGNVLSSYVIGDQDIKTTYSDSAFTIRDDYYGQDILTYDSVVSGGGNTIGNVDIDLRTNINADLQVNSGDILRKDGKQLNYAFTGTGFDLDNSMQSYDGYVPIILNHNYTPSLGFETGFQARQWSDQANTLFSVPRFAMMKFPTGNSNPLDTANVTNTTASTFIMPDGAFSGVMDSKIQRKRDYVYTSNTSQVYAEGAAAHSVGSILYRTDTSNTEVISQGTLGGGAFKTRAYVAQGIIAFRTMQPAVAANINSAFPYNEGTDSADSTVVFINDKLNVGNEEDANLAYSFPKTPGTNGQVLQLDSNYDLQWANLGAGSGTVTSVDSGDGLTGGPVTTSGTLAVGAGNGITVNADDVAVDESYAFNFTGAVSSANLSLQQFQETVVNMGNQGGNIAAVADFNAANGSIFTFTATSDFEISQIPNAQPGSSYTIKVTQDGTGDKVLTSTFKFAGGDKTMSVAADAIDVISVVYDGTDYLASLTKAYA